MVFIRGTAPDCAATKSAVTPGSSVVTQPLTFENDKVNVAGPDILLRINTIDVPDAVRDALPLPDVKDPVQLNWF